MKTCYFSQDKPDGDDEILAKQIAEGGVPPGCLLGGIVVQRIRDMGEDPCGLCPCERTKCGGRAPKQGVETITDGNGWVHGHDSDSAAYRRLQRASHIKTLNALCRPKT